jgi:hypothetical protein
MAFPTTGILETFSAANGTSPPSANWTNALEGIECQSGVAAPVTGGTNDNVAFWNAALFGPDCEAYCTITDLDGYFYLLLRSTTLVIDTFDGYGLVCDRSTSPDDWVVQELLNGGATTIASATQNLSVNDKVGFEAIGSNLKAYHYTGGAWNPTPIISTSDSTYTAAGYVGIDLYNNANLDDFGGGTVVVTAAITGTATASITEADIVTGGKTIIITLTGDTWRAA